MLHFLRCGGNEPRASKRKGVTASRGNGLKIAPIAIGWDESLNLHPVFAGLSLLSKILKSTHQQINKSSNQPLNKFHPERSRRATNQQINKFPPTASPRQLQPLLTNKLLKNELSTLSRTRKTLLKPFLSLPPTHKVVGRFRQRG